MTSTRKTFASLVLLFVVLAIPARADEGMYPLSVLSKLDLHAKGLKISSSDIYNPGGVGLIDAIVQVGGCTGSFVSGDGLIITNHHCAFGIVQAASSTEHDYITNGYLAKDRATELPGKGVTVRITESYKDVSAEVLAAVSDTMDPVARTKAIDKAIRAMVAATEQANPGKRAEVSEMFQGRTYWLFVYTFLRDVRAVYVPARGIGEFGGENDNWVWPRHTGDFSFLRAYVAPDGSPADYSPSNVPYHPRKFLKVNPDGVEWVLADLAVLSCGGVSNGIYPTDAASQVHYLCEDSRTRVLFVEDEEALPLLLRYNLEREGYRVVEAKDGEEALIVADEEGPDLVILDWMLPQLSGIEICRRMRGHGHLRNVPIVMLTARGEEGDRIRGLDTGADDYITKPFSMRELLARVKSLLRRTNAAGEVVATRTEVSVTAS